MCLWNDVPETLHRPVTESSLAQSKLRGRKALSLPLMPHAWSQINLDGYDTVIASSHAFSHHLASRAARMGRRGFAYVHTPARYVWAPEVEARGRSLAARLGSVPLKTIDRRAADPRVHYAANSEFIRERIRRAWGVDAEVIYPPVDIERIRSVDRWIDVLPSAEAQIFEGLPRDGFILGASRLVPYKRLDLVIELGAAMDVPVVIAGSGPEEGVLRALAASASVPVHFTGRVTDEQLYALYQEAMLFVFLAIEDFGIMPVECVAAGTPVLVNAAGGASESVPLLGAGQQVEIGPTAEDLVGPAIEAIGTDVRRGQVATDRFSLKAFQKRIQRWIEDGG